MKVSQDYVDLFAAFNAHEVEYLVVGAHALAAYGHIRATKDIDVWVRPTSANARRAYRALADFGAPLSDLTESDLAREGVVFQIGVSPLRIDIITRIDGVSFDEAWPDRLTTSFGNQRVFVLSRAHLVQNKRAAGRTQDLADLERLESPEED